MTPLQDVHFGGIEIKGIPDVVNQETEKSPESTNIGHDTELKNKGM